MKKQLQWMLAAILALCGTMMTLNSCSDHEDNPAGNQLEKQIVGKWYLEDNEPGIYHDGDISVAFQKLVMYTSFEENGTGFWATIFLDGSNQAIDIPGHFAGGRFGYTIKANNTISIEMTSAGIPNVEESFDMQYSNGRLTMKGDEDVYMTPITAEQDANVQQWLQQLGLGALAEYYNINDGTITRDNWRQQEAIYVYDGVGRDVKDAEGRTGYSLVNLPWYKGDKQTNLPAGFCDDITPEDGWEWVLNRCGSYGIVNNNFFALYNVYSGILRFFYYMPKDFSSGNDHLWQITITDNLASNSTWRYGVPLNTTIQDRSAIGQTSSRTFRDYVAPWVDYKSADGLIVPNVGWWAFDVDFSLYNKKKRIDSDAIRLQMRTWNAQHMSLTSAVKANIDGTVNLNQTKTTVTAAKGVIGVLTDLKDIWGNINEAITQGAAGNYGGAIKSAVAMGKNAYALYGAIKSGAHTDVDTLSNINGTINMGLTGNIDTEGMLQGSVPAVNIASPTFQFDDFDFTNAPCMGEGIWNLAESPVVYYTNASISWRYDYSWFESTAIFGIPGEGIGQVQFYDMKSPFGGQRVAKAARVREKVDYTYTKEPYRGHVCFFDPSSIKLQLNPNLFTQEEIDGAQVYAVCGVRRGMKLGSTENYRQALGLAGSHIAPPNTYGYCNRPYDEPPYDALSSFTDKMGLKTVSKFEDTVNGHQYGMFGRGDDAYLLEPQCLTDNNGPDMMPAYEVTVTVIVNHNGKPIMYSRSYLPEFKFIDAADVPDKAMMMEKMPANYITAGYEQQVEHIDDLYKWLHRTFQPFDGNTLVGDKIVATVHYGFTFDKPEECYPSLVDGDPTTKWCSSKKARDAANDVYNPIIGWYSPEYSGTKSQYWYVDFITNLPVSPVSYTLTTGNDTQKFPERNPRKWKLFGRKSLRDEWTLLSEINDADNNEYMLSPTNNASTTIPFNKQMPKDMRFFRLLVDENWGDDCLQLGELKFNYDD